MKANQGSTVAMDAKAAAAEAGRRKVISYSLSRMSVCLYEFSSSWISTIKDFLSVDSLIL